MEDVNHKYPNTAIPIAIIIIVIIPMVFALFINARKAIEIKRQYSNASHSVKPICNTSTNFDCRFTDIFPFDVQRTEQE